MEVVLYGATGNSGQRILQELIKRGHQVTAVARNISKLPLAVKAVKDNLSNIDVIASVIAGADVVVSAYAPPQDNTDALVGVTERQIAAVKKAGVPRLIVVGGAAIQPGLVRAPDGQGLRLVRDRRIGQRQSSAHGTISWPDLSSQAVWSPARYSGREHP